MYPRSLTRGTGDANVEATLANLARLHTKCSMPGVFQRTRSPRAACKRAVDSTHPRRRDLARAKCLVGVDQEEEASGTRGRRRLAGDEDLQQRWSAIR
jgi:hypothetical protein